MLTMKGFAMLEVFKHGTAFARFSARSWGHRRGSLAPPLRGHNLHERHPRAGTSVPQARAEARADAKRRSGKCMSKFA
jgi:hypothetical protein